MKKYLKKIVSLLLALLIIFTAIALFSFIQFKRGKDIFDIGLPYYVEDIMVFSLSLFAIVIVVYDLYCIETKTIVGPKK